MTIKATVTVMLQVTVHDKWGEGCALKQVYDQATSAAIAMVKGAIHRDGEPNKFVSIIGTPKVEAIITTREQ